MSRKRIIIIAIIIIVLLFVAFYFLLPRKQGTRSVNIGGNQPVKTIVPQGGTVTPDGKNNSSGTSTSNNSTNSPTTKPTTQQFYDAIVQADGVAPDADGKVRFGVTSIKQPLPGWYVVTIVKTGVEPNKVIFQQTNDPKNPVTIFAGPGTSFPPEFVSLPDAVRKAL